MSTADSRQPLAGKRVLVTRAASPSDSLRQQLEQLGATVVAIPTIEIRPPRDFASLDSAIAQIATYDWSIFTSANAVEYFFQRFREKGCSVDTPGFPKVAVVGPATARGLRENGIIPHLEAQDHTAEGLLESFNRAMSAEGRSLSGQRILFPRARVAREVLPDELTRLGGCVDVVEAYETICPPGLRDSILSALAEGPFDLLIFTSSSTASNLARAMDTKDLSSVFPDAKVASIGRVTSNTLFGLGLRVTIEPGASTTKDLVDAISIHFGICQ